MKNRKFRVWDKFGESWTCDYSNDWIGTGIGNIGGPDIQPWRCMSLKGEIMSNDNMGGFVDSNQENYIIQQYIGINDNNGKEIYEGDIVSCGKYGPVEVRYDDYYCGYMPFIQRLDEERQVLATDPYIIGNIFENSDLLK